jgi:hydroxymethylglutaryl-CoA synthase
MQYQYVSQSDLEPFLGASKGKYTIGLGQTNMSFCDDREGKTNLYTLKPQTPLCPTMATNNVPDTNSLALTTVSALLSRNNIDTCTIGRLEVGTETPLDKAKSTKTVLMQLFAPNGDIEGVDTYNACYGGTAAFLNAVHWIESSAWDGRDAIVVAVDIAMYDTVAARPTGGAGCVAMLVGANAELVIEPLRASYMRHEYDFYKPDFGSEYPLVDRSSSTRYIEALDMCYRGYRGKKNGVVRMQGEGDVGLQSSGLNGRSTEHRASLDEFDFFVFHAPNCKLVSKAYARLLWNDFVAYADNSPFGLADVPSTIRELDYRASLQDKSLEKLFIELSRERFSQRVQPCLTCPTMCGNMYTATLYSGLVSLLSNVPSEELFGKRIGMFSFGSGLASTLFSLRVVGDVQRLAQGIDLHARLAEREKMSPEFYDKVSKLCLQS